MSPSPDSDTEMAKNLPDSANDENDDVSPNIAARRRIRYFDDTKEGQAEVQHPGNESGTSLSRRASSFSIRSAQSLQRGERVIDPALSLPVAYRTVSFNISNTQERAAFEAKRAKQAAEQGNVIQSGKLFKPD